MQTLPHGSWPSPVDARATLSASISRSVPRADGEDLYWLEARPADRGRVTLVRRTADGRREDVSLPGQNVRTGYLEYGGGEYAVSRGHVLWVDLATDQVWLAAPGTAPRTLTPETDGKVRWSCFRVDHERRQVLCLREDQREPELEPVNSLVRLDLDGDNEDLGTVLVEGRRRVRSERGQEAVATNGSTSGPDFVTDPARSPDGSRLAWLTWDHPDMPWDSTTLWTGRLDEAGDLHDARPVAGAGAGEPVQALEQPLWLDERTLLVISDRSGAGNLWRLDAAEPGSVLVPLTAGELELGQPRWVPDTRAYALLPDGRVLAARSELGFRHLVLVDPVDGTTTRVEADLAYVRDLSVRPDGQVFLDATPTGAGRTLLVLDPLTGSTWSPLPDEPEPVPEGFAAEPEAVSWTSADGDTAHGFLYRPVHPQVQAPEGDLPPLVVTLHGGPTACAMPGATAKRSFWTSRGFAVLDVNYGGSTGYGRAYRDRLRGRWGEVDVQDAATGAAAMAERGLVDGARMAITGGSAGGFTTLAAATFTDVFAAGASHFGVSDLATLAGDTHKLESRYTDGLVAPWPEAAEVYAERSPIHHVDRLRTPLILLQGTEDKVVPPAQAETMAAALREQGLPVALVMFEGEGHGFRALGHQVQALEAELSFYAQVFGLDLADDIEPVEVENLASRD